MTTPDPGLFGPDSITWRVHGDPVLAVGGLRALVLQSLHPLAMAGVAQHSGFRSDPWGRLQRTAEYIGQISFGTTVEAERAAARVRGIHRKLAGTDPDTGASFRIDDPELLLWVHCCEVDSFLSTVRRAGLPLTDDDAERYLGEQVLAATLVGLRADAVPASAGDLADYFTEVRPRLRLSPQAREAARFLLLPPMPTWVQWLTPARPAWAVWPVSASPCYHGGHAASTSCRGCPPQMPGPPPRCVACAARSSRCPPRSAKGHTRQRLATGSPSPRRHDAALRRGGRAAGRDELPDL